MRRFSLVLLATIAAALSDRVGYAAEGDTLITDPVLLTRLGFPSDARNVYLAKGAVLDQKSSPAGPKEFGTNDFGWTTVLGMQHHPIGSDTAYEAAPDGSIWFFSGTHPAFGAQLQMPSGSLLDHVTWFGSTQNVAEFLTAVVVRVCQTGFPAVGPPVVTLLGNASSSGTGSFTFTVSVPAGETVHNFSCGYFARMAFNGSGTDLDFFKVRAGWKRQVSLAPLSATFPNDTPTTHPYFRFIEALAASGITAGCAPQSFCPNAAITRGEMAVFLAAALGLHSPN
jgi:hypothetical protein